MKATIESKGNSAMYDPKAYFSELHYPLPPPVRPIRVRSVPEVMPSGCKVYEFPKPAPLYVIGTSTVKP